MVTVNRVYVTFSMPMFGLADISISDYLSARRDTVLPLMTPIKGLDGEEIREIPVPNGTKVTIGLMASNTNPKLWGADADEWKPERWLSPLPEEVTAAHLPGVYSNL